MALLDGLNAKFTELFIPNYEEVENHNVRIRHGMLAGWVSIVAILALFVIKVTLGIRANSISVLANAFHLLSHLANSVILIVSFSVTARPATSKNPFGHGRMEHIAPLIMSIFLFVSGIQLAESSFHRALDPHEVHYWPALIWILLATILVKQLLAQYVRFLGKRVKSHAILTNAAHHTIEAVMSLAVIGGLIVGHYFHHPEVDGVIGILVSLWLLYLGFSHGREALVPLLGQAPDREMIQRIRKTILSVNGIEGVHEVIVHDYGSIYTMSMHVEIPEKLGAVEMHEIAEHGEALLRKTFGGEAICHMDPLLEKTPEIQAVEDRFREIMQGIPEIISYHDFRVVAHSQDKILVIADIDVQENVPESEFAALSKELESKVIQAIPNVEYCSFYVTPKYAY